MNTGRLVLHQFPQKMLLLEIGDLGLSVDN